jgi:Domain of unknown function (DUF4331)
MSDTIPFRRKSWLAFLLLAAVTTIAGVPHAQASSHREAPFITKQPKVDGTDFYMFRSYEAGRQDYVTLVANYIPLQPGYGGPNFFNMDANALYEIHIDNDADAKEDLTFQFRFKNKQRNIALTVGGKSVAAPLVNLGPVANVADANLNVVESYTIDVVRGDRRKGNRQSVTNAADGKKEFIKPFDNAGKKTFADYAGYAAKHIYSVNIPGCSAPGKVFVGQRKEPFAVNLGEVFDLVNVKVPATDFDANAEKLETNILDDDNITAIALEVPIACVTKDANTPIIGGWTTASLRQARLLDPTPRSRDKDDDKGFDSIKRDGNSSLEGGPWVQVSRLSAPLVNEVIIGLKDKDKFNHSQPKDDGQFADYVTNPTLPAIVESLFSAAGVKAPTNFPRTDLVAAFLTGVDTLNKPTGVKAAEMMRLNTSIAPAAKGAQKRLGVIGGDNAGFPNGRRPGDDVVDIELRVAMGKLCTVAGVNALVGCVATDAPAGAIGFTDGAFLDDSVFDAVFPYLTTPVASSPNGVSD